MSTPEKKGAGFTPFVPEDTDLPELTIRAVVLGVLMALVLGAANAYLGMKVGLTVAATFPAAVVAMAALRMLGGSVLEENISRTTASVGEALAAGAIFTIPAFVISGVWDELRYLESTAIMLVGGLLGVLFIIVLRRTMVVEADLPFPESVAAAELVKAGQGGQTGAKYVFQAMGLAGAWELVKNSNGVQLVSSSATTFVNLGRSTIDMVGRQVSYLGGFILQSPVASPALVGVGFIVGPAIASTLFAGAVLGWLLLVPLGLFLNPDLAAEAIEAVELFAGNPEMASAAALALIELNPTLETEPTVAQALIAHSTGVWSKQVRPLAVGTMIVAAFYTLFKLRTPLILGIGRAFTDIQKAREWERERDTAEPGPRLHEGRHFDPGPVCAAAGPLLLLHPGPGRRDRADHRDGHPRVSLLRGGRVSRGAAGQLEQPDQRADTQHVADSGHPHGRPRGDRSVRHPGRPRRGRRGLLCLRHRRRHVAGPEGGAHPRRDTVEDGSRGDHRCRGRRHGPDRADDWAARGLRDRQRRAAGASGGADGIDGRGHCRRRDGVATGHHRGCSWRSGSSSSTRRRRC